MKTIGDILARDLSKKIVEVIQVDQDKDEDLYSEITEYIATDSIKEQYATLLKAIAEAPADPHDSVGVWISGFFGSGWELDMLRLLLATLFRAGTIEATHQGSRYHNYQDPLCRKIFTNTPAFRGTLFSPRQSLGLKTLTQAVQQLEELTGEEVDVEEGAIATAFKKLASEEMEKLLPLKAMAEAHSLPIIGLVKDFQQTLSGIQSSSSDDCVRILNETGDIFEENREKVRQLRTTAR